MSSPVAGAAITFASGPFTHDRSSPSAASLTLPGVGFGATDTHRQVILAIGGLSADGRVSGVTVAGAAATQIAATTYTSGVQPFISIWAVSMPTGASGDVVLTFDAPIYSIGLTAYRLIKSDGFSIYDVIDRPAAKISSIDLSLMTKAGGAFLGVAQAYGSGTHNWTWTPNVEHVDVDIRSGEQYSTGGVSDTVADGIRAQTVDFTTASNFITGIGVSWDGPAAPEGVTGTASGSFLTSLAAAGAVAIAGFASGGFAASTASAGSAEVRGSASAAFVASGDAAGAAGLTGQAAGAFDASASSVARAVVAGAAAGKFSAEAMSTGQAAQAPGSGSAFGAFAFAASAAGVVNVSGGGYAGFLSEGVAVAQAGPVPLVGIGAAGFALDADAAGGVPILGSGAGAFHADHSAIGRASVEGTGSADFDLTGSAFGGRPIVGAAEGSFSTAVVSQAISLERSFLPAKTRTVLIAHESRSIMAGSTIKKWPNKHPADVLDYDIDWSAEIGPDTIVANEWDLPAGLTLESSERSGGLVKAWISGGAFGRSYTVASSITTAAGRTFNRSVTLEVGPR